MKAVSKPGDILREADPFGAKVLEDGRVRFRAWVPGQQETIPEGMGNPRVYFPETDETLEMNSPGGGWYELVTGKASHGTQYMLELWNADKNDWWRVPDPMSYQQAGSVHGPAMVVDPARLDWSAEPDDWRGVPLEEMVIYELHIGSLTGEGSFEAAISKLDYLKELGVTAIEIMPTNAAGSKAGWSYDGVLDAALQPEYGTPQNLVNLIAAAHARGIAVINDKVDNHLGPDGNYLWVTTPEMWSDEKIPWGGKAFDMQKPEIRAFFRQQNDWLHRCYRYDGVRRDAVHAIKHAPEEGDKHFLTELYEEAKTLARETGRHYVTILENEKNRPSLLDPENAGNSPGVRGNAQWGDDFQNAFRSLLFRDDPARGYTNKGYYKPYQEDPLATLAEVLTSGYAFSLETPRNTETTDEDTGTPFDPRRSVFFTHNHDQVGNTPNGYRIETLLADDPFRRQKLEMAAKILLLGPFVPMLFMGQEQASEKIFPFFALWQDEGLQEIVRQSRYDEFPDFPKGDFLDPCDEKTFKETKLGEVLNLPRNQWFALYKRLITERKDKIVPHLSSGVEKAEYRRFGQDGLEVTWTFGDGAVSAMRMNFGNDPVVFPEFDNAGLASEGRSLSGEFAGASGAAVGPWEMDFVHAEAQRGPGPGLKPGNKLLPTEAHNG